MKKDKYGLTTTQRDNLQEWFERMKEDTGKSWTESIIIFNNLEIEFQQKIIRNVWYSKTTGKKINRQLLPS
tara:strand:+ start:6568 stop:6780 length:213 start_codon:yes stop_codon:yes gene_type:complete